MIAIIETGGTQHSVTAGDVIRVQRMPEANGNEIIFDKVVMVSKDSQVHLGTPYLSNAHVKAEMLGEGLFRKVYIFKKKPRKGHKKFRGHRQKYMELKIASIHFGG